MRKEILKSKAKLLAAMQRQGMNCDIERPNHRTLPVHPYMPHCELLHAL